VSRVGDGAHGGGAALVVDVSDCLRAYIQHESVDQLDVVAVPWLVRHLGGDNGDKLITSHCPLESNAKHFKPGRDGSYLQVAAQLRQEGDW